LGIEYYAAFPGCSSETTASFSTVITLAQKIDELFLPCVLTIDGSADAIAETVIENTEKKNARILSINSMQVYRSDESFDYIDVMRENLEILKIALDCE
jgi:zinc transport system substrate-binding protein